MYSILKLIMLDRPDIAVKLIGTFAIFALSLAGYVVPLNISRIKYLQYYSSDDNSFYHNMKAFSSGVILGVALLHLLAEALESFDGFSEYPGDAKEMFCI